jgi:hypothetical protein
VDGGRRDARHDAEGHGRQAPGAARLLRRAGRGPGATRPEPRARRLLPGSRRAAGALVGSRSGRSRAGRHGDGCQLRAVLDGCHPSAGRPLGRLFGDSSARGFDATFSAPKSVSVLWALRPDPWVRAEVLAAHDAAVDAALGWFERHGAVTRRGRDGVFQVDTLGVTAALFRQHTSRSIDPQLLVVAGRSAVVRALYRAGRRALDRQRARSVS